MMEHLSSGLEITKLQV